MERESNPMEALCRSGCGFYGNPATDGLCSVCFKEALKKKQQPPATTPSAVSTSFVAAPTPLSAAAPTVPALPVQPQIHTDSKCLTHNYKITIMEDDPNQRESKGKRLLKKAIRRNSKSSNNSQNSVPNSQKSITVSRSKSFENKRLSVEINDSTSLPTPDGTTDKAEHTPVGLKIVDKMQKDELKLKKTVGVNEKFNTIHEEAATISKDPKDFPKLEDSAEIGTSKKNLKRKLEEESGAGTSGASAGASDTDADDKDSKDKKKKNRCAVCRKKVGLTGFECRCGGLFCAVHRYSDKHECSFDYRELGAQEIRRNNPVVVSQKIHKI